MQLIPSESCNPPPHPPLTHSDRQEGLNRSRCVVPKVDKFVIHTTTYKESSRHRSDKPKACEPNCCHKISNANRRETARGWEREGSHLRQRSSGQQPLGASSTPE